MAITAGFFRTAGLLSVTGDNGDDVITISRSMWRWLKISLFDPSRPELHYMRGLGPKSLEKYAREGLGSRARSTRISIDRSWTYDHHPICRHYCTHLHGRRDRH